MSLDPSLKAANALIRHRNVLKRDECLAKLQEEEKWTDGKIFGLPKVGHRKAALAAKPVKEEAVEGAVAGAAGAAAPAAGAAKAGAPKAAAPAAKGAAAPAKAAAPAAKGKK